MALDLRQLDGTNGFRVVGIEASDYSGASVAGAGDVNGDGVDDLIVGAGGANGLAGESYVVFGTDIGFPASFDLAALDGSNGFRLPGIDPTGNSGSSVAGAGDVNGDGIDDLIIGAPGDYSSPGAGYAGESYVVFGTDTGFAASFDLSALDGSTGFRFDGINARDHNGRSVAGTGDVNGDGIDDLIVGAPGANPDGRSYAGESYVVFGTESGFPASLDRSALDGSNGFRLEGINAGDRSGVSVSGAGDVNGDGIDDLIVGAWGADPNGNSYAGASYVVFGTEAGFAASFDLSALDGANGFRIDGIDADDRSGNSVAGAGDVNGDGNDDLIINAPSQYGIGESYVVFGTDTGFPASLELSALDGSNGFRIVANDYSSASVAGAGDVNGDGFDDLIVGVPAEGPEGKSYAGASYVVFGTDAGFSGSIDLAALDGSNGFRLDGIDADDYSGFSVARGGDINGDGIDDLIVGAPGAEPEDQSDFLDPGTSYVIFGSTQFGGGNDAPLAAADFIEVGAFGRVDLAADNGSGKDRDPDLDDVSVVEIDGTAVAPGDSVTLASGLQVTLIGGTEVRFDAPGVALATVLSDSFVYELSDGRGGSASATVTVDFTENGIALADLDGSNGFRIHGTDADDRSGTSVAGAGDVNGDGLGDLIVGAPGEYTDGIPSASYVVFGTDGGFGGSFDLAAIDGTNGFRIDGYDYSSVGYSVAGAGDVNGDGFDDVIVGDPNYFNEGPSYVVFGSAAGVGASIDVTALDGTNGFSLSDGAHSVAGAGDINGDGFDDVVVGPFIRENYTAGVSYVVFGTDTGFGANLDLDDLDGSSGFRMTSGEGEDILSVAGAGDVNGDGIDDVIVATPFASASYVVFGTTAGFAANLDLASLDGSDGFRLVSADAYDLAGAGDFNGDGIDDLIVGAPGGKSSAGDSYVVFGKDTGFTASLDLSELDGSNGFRIDGIDADDRTGTSVGGAGDFNGDGIDDLVIGAPGADGGAGESYIVLGTDSGVGASLDLTELDGRNGFRLVGIDEGDGSGRSIAGAGDVNGDGFDDLIVGAPGANGFGGESYVVFGFETSEPLTQIFGGPGNDVLTGSDASEAFHPGGGRDFVTTGGGEDTIFFDDRGGERDVLTIADFDPLADTLDLHGAAVAKSFECATKTVLLLEGPDCDAVVLLGLSESPLDLI